MDLKTKILAFIIQHASGVSIIDIEKSLGERRMRIGYVTQCLLDEGMIRKIEDKYYPLNEDEESQHFIKSIATVLK